MSDKELFLDAIERLPNDATAAQINDRVAFIAALKQAEQSLDRGEGVPIREVEKQFSSWVKQWRSKSTGRRKR
jgi:hypothetical protein